jgi:hypothetical protein
VYRIAKPVYKVAGPITNPVRAALVPVLPRAFEPRRTYVAMNRAGGTVRRGTKDDVHRKQDHTDQIFWPRSPLPASPIFCRVQSTTIVYDLSTRGFAGLLPHLPSYASIYVLLKPAAPYPGPPPILLVLRE